RQTPHDRLERAFQFGAAAGLQFDEGDDVILNIEEATPPAVPNQPVKVQIQDVTAAGPVQRTTEVHASGAVQTPSVAPTTPPKKRMPAVRVLAAKVPPQVVASQKAAASAPPRPPAGK